jgi:hypothetical protein
VIHVIETFGLPGKAALALMTVALRSTFLIPLFIQVYFESTADG